MISPTKVSTRVSGRLLLLFFLLAPSAVLLGLELSSGAVPFRCGVVTMLICGRNAVDSGVANSAVGMIGGGLLTARTFVGSCTGTGCSCLESEDCPIICGAVILRWEVF